MAFVGKKFPNISVNAMNDMGDTFKLNVLEEAQKNNKKVVLFWYPKDFTFVCPTELHAFQAAIGEFEKRNTLVIGASCDTPEVHFAWLSTDKDNGGIEGVTYPILADSNRNLSSVLGILDIQNEVYDEETETVQVEGDNVTYRATYIIDEEGVVQHESINNMPLGRNVGEYLRLVDALTHVQEKGEVCPANWEEGKEAMSANRDGVASYLSAHAN
ncbi:peroxiredoxin (alkyl hydroperoxide reductase subunit C) [Maribacter caenipelagi]|uniref:Thioredoxin peroxidase n=2 Tax=Maribacter TaxID=252356 RepID=A0A4R7D416_9FLAO|nr:MULTISPECIES: peroxiredoxin [Maribacter]APA65632.1 alkyl hydroperoxide reductase [Maribacter sp. 1_2014MBL_MicDiv]KSA11783.1 Alkyl hydroperoxide reductase subunit C-like protein [Maribacter dokdonensis DSW-8]PHN93528.1 peroxiredoxin [Maribacter sp. 6B07]TDS13606.1 peroxiredoxin (alkyl hydroperoxide reductase subunit C) [Maribacter caenipelagi]SDS65244.1 peroxiredoxin (alkyl hydroperoxide reductase subunit C) [Maribacter dokdonensis]|tara:strand:- start:770 stop:1414 length:645 start_codon:yes stop_codon:yes gene_type:complete